MPESISLTSVKKKHSEVTPVQLKSIETPPEENKNPTTTTTNGGVHETNGNVVDKNKNGGLAVDGVGNSAYVEIDEDQAGKQVKENDYEKFPKDTLEADEEETTGCLRKVEDIQNSLKFFWDQHGSTINWALAAACIVGYAVYFGYAMRYEFGSESSIRLLWMTLLGVLIVMVMVVQNSGGDYIQEHIITPIGDFVNRHYLAFKVCFLVLVLVGVITVIVVEVALKDPYNLISAVGYLVFVVLVFVFSANPAKVRWRTVLWGLGIQFVFALLVLKTVWGYEVFKWIGDRISEFMAYTDEGSIFVFGESYEDHFFAMKVMPVVIFFSCVISVLYYLGIMEVIISKIAWVMQRTMGTTAAESTNAAGNIFIGQTEAPLLIRPLINNMSNSEIHAVMVGGYATIAGSVLATYILLGVPANHLVTASVMAAPCALAMSKLSYPETDKSKLKSGGMVVMEKLPYRNVIEAASAGATQAIPLVANIIVNIIAFIAIIAFFNTTLTWMGHRVGLWSPEYPELTFQLICSYMLWPFAFLMGVAQEDCGKVAELIGIKTFVNEFVAYTELGKLIDNTEYYNAYNGTSVDINGDLYLPAVNVTLYGGVLQERSIIISTYALCGFANIASIGTVIGALGAMAPQKTSDISSMAVRAMITGTIVSLMNASIAGLFFEPTT